MGDAGDLAERRPQRSVPQTASATSEPDRLRRLAAEAFSDAPPPAREAERKPRQPRKKVAAAAASSAGWEEF